MTCGTLTFRFAEPGDIPAIVDLVESAYRGESSRAGWTTEADLLDGQRTDAEAVAEIVADAPARLLSPRQTACSSAAASLSGGHPAEAYFGMFSVRPAAQGQGWGGRSWPRPSGSPVRSGEPPQW